MHDFHAAIGARFLTLDDTEFVAGYGDAGADTGGNAEYHALRRAAGVIDLSGRGRLVLLGADRAKFLNGQVTNNVKDLRPGQGCYAALVTAKAKMVADLNVYALENELLLDLEPGRSAAVAARLEHYVIADDVQIVDAAPHYGLLGVQGPRAARVVEALGCFANLPSTALAHVMAVDDTFGELHAMCHARGGTRGYDLFVPGASLTAVAERLIAAARDVGGGPVGWDAFEVVRIEAGIPRYGVDMNETNLPPECGIDERAISYTKGCYIGQEVIARLRTYGQVAKALRGLRLPADLTALPASGTKLFREGKEVGHLTSRTRSPALAGPVALGYVRRECNAPGTELAVGSPDATVRATIVALPFVGPEFATAR